MFKLHLCFFNGCSLREEINRLTSKGMSNTSLKVTTEYSLWKHMVRKHYCNFRYVTNMLKIRSRRFDRAQYFNLNHL